MNDILQNLIVPIVIVAMVLLFILFVYVIAALMIRTAKTPAEKKLQADLAKHVLTVPLLREVILFAASRLNGDK